MRWTDQARGILSSTAGQVMPIIEATSEDAKDPIKGNMDRESNKEKVAKLQTDLTAAKENYAQLTTNHWSVIQNVSDRQAADTALDKAMEWATALVNLFEQEDIDPDELTGVLGGLNKEMGKFNAKITEMLKRVTPPSTEQPAA